MKKRTIWETTDHEGILKDWKDETNWFNGTVNIDDLYEMFRHDMHLGEAETQVVLASLLNAIDDFELFDEDVRFNKS